MKTYTINPPNFKVILNFLAGFIIVAFIFLLPIFIHTPGTNNSIAVIVLTGSFIFVVMLGLFIVFREPTITIYEDKLIIESWGSYILHLNRKFKIPQQKISSNDVICFPGNLYSLPYCTLNLWKEYRSKTVGIHFYLIDENKLKKQIQSVETSNEEFTSKEKQ